MARERSWWSLSTDLSQWTGIQHSVDLLEGSGLAVPGATIQRVIGRVDVQGIKASQTAATILYVSLLAASSAQLGQILGRNSLDYLAWLSVPLDRPESLKGDTVGTEPWWDSTEVDSAGQRRLVAGESLWLGLRSIRLDPTAGYQGRITFRTLVLLPEGMSAPAPASERDDSVTTPLVVGEDGHLSGGVGPELQRI